MMRAGASLTENRFFNNCGGKLFAKTGPILLDSNTETVPAEKGEAAQGIVHHKGVAAAKPGGAGLSITKIGFEYNFGVSCSYENGSTAPPIPGRSSAAFQSSPS